MPNINGRIEMSWNQFSSSLGMAFKVWVSR
jgi:hypothetical protein